MTTTTTTTTTTKTVYSMHGYSQQVDGDLAIVQHGEHRPEGYVPDRSWTVRVRPGHHHLRVESVVDCLVSSIRMHELRGEPVDLPAICRGIEKSADAFLGAWLTPEQATEI